MTDHELALLACMQASPRIAAEASTLLRSTDFTVHEHQVLFATMQQMISSGEAVDSVTLPTTLRQDGHEGDVVRAAERLPHVASELDSISNGSEYARLVLEASLRRAIMVGTDRLGAVSDPEAMVQHLEKLTYDTRSRLMGDNELSHYDQASIVSTLEASLSRSKDSRYLPYPIPWMRQQYGSYETGRYSVIGGYSGDGKTTFAVQWIEELLRAGAKCAIYELEMTGLGMSRLLMQQGGGLSRQQLRDPEAMDLAAWERFEHRRREMQSWDLHIKTGAVTPSQIRADQVRERYDVILVDHMQKFERTSAGEYADLTKYSGQLHRITRDLGASVIVLSQLNKRRYDDHSEPDVSKLRGGTILEEDADEVLLVYAERQPNRMRFEDRRSLLIIGKMRDGEADAARQMMLDKESAKFREVSTDSLKVVSW
jgi:replicative DNA helicase